MFITTFEILKDSIVDDLRSFYTNGFDEFGSTVEPEYQTKLLYKSKSPVYASLQWLRENDAIDDEELKKTRNLLAHHLFSVVSGEVESAHEPQFDALVALLRKISVRWVDSVDILTNPDFDGQEINEEGIVSCSILTLQMLIEKWPRKIPSYLNIGAMYVRKREQMSNQSVTWAAPPLTAPAARAKRSVTDLAVLDCLQWAELRRLTSDKLCQIKSKLLHIKNSALY